jgi:hypothetical protein
MAKGLFYLHVDYQTKKGAQSSPPKRTRHPGDTPQITAGRSPSVTMAARTLKPTKILSENAALLLLEDPADLKSLKQIKESPARVNSPLRKPPGEGTGPTIHAEFPRRSCRPRALTRRTGRF